MNKTVSLDTVLLIMHETRCLCSVEVNDGFKCGMIGCADDKNQTVFRSTALMARFLWSICFVGLLMAVGGGGKKKKIMVEENIVNACIKKWLWASLAQEQ